MLTKTKIVLHGDLGTAVGRREWSFYVNTPAEAFQAIEVMSDGKLTKHLCDNLMSAYHVVLDGEGVVDVNELNMERPMKEMHVLPVLSGSGNDMGMWLAIIGIVIVAIVAIPFTGGGSLWAGGSIIWGMVGTLGISLALTGISMMLAPNPDATKERPENKPSYLFNGAVNTYRQGNPVPVGVGIMRVGSQVISAGVVNMKTSSATDRFEISFREEIDGSDGGSRNPDIPHAAQLNPMELDEALPQAKLTQLKEDARV